MPIDSRVILFAFFYIGYILLGWVRMCPKTSAEAIENERILDHGCDVCDVFSMCQIRFLASLQQLLGGKRQKLRTQLVRKFEFCPSKEKK